MVYKINFVCNHAYIMKKIIDLIAKNENKKIKLLINVVYIIFFLEVEMDRSRTWCPRAGCETVCTLCSTDRCTPQSVHCPTCNTDFCSNCRSMWHSGSPCKSEEVVPGVTFDSELIKCCPMCCVPIEKDEGCAQMLCKRCKHVFCWYCLASLDVSTLFFYLFFIQKTYCCYFDVYRVNIFVILIVKLCNSELNLIKSRLKILLKCEFLTIVIIGKDLL